MPRQSAVPGMSPRERIRPLGAFVALYCLVEVAGCGAQSPSDELYVDSDAALDVALLRAASERYCEWKLQCRPRFDSTCEPEWDWERETCVASHVNLHALRFGKGYACHRAADGPFDLWQAGGPDPRYLRLNGQRAEACARPLADDPCRETRSYCAELWELHPCTL